MKKVVISLLIILLTTITSFSQTISKEIKQDSIVFITSEQLKYTNLIFVEHEKLIKENSLLNNQINNYQNKISLYKELDTLRLSQIKEYQILNEQYLSQIKKKNIINIGCVTISVGVILFLLLK